VRIRQLMGRRSRMPAEQQSTRFQRKPVAATGSNPGSSDSATQAVCCAATSFVAQSRPVRPLRRRCLHVFGL